MKRSGGGGGSVNKRPRTRTRSIRTVDERSTAGLEFLEQLTLSDGSSSVSQNNNFASSSSNGASIFSSSLQPIPSLGTFGTLAVNPFFQPRERHHSVIEMQDAPSILPTLQRSPSVRHPSQLLLEEDLFYSQSIGHNISPFLQRHQTLRQQSMRHDTIAVENVGVRDSRFFEDYFVRSIRLGLYLYLLPYVFQDRLQQTSDSDAVFSSVSNEIKTLALLSEVQSEQLMTLFKGFDWSNAEKSGYYQYNNLQNPIVDAVYETFFNKNIKTKQDISQAYFLHVDTQLKSFLEQQIAAELFGIKQETIDANDVVTLVEFCLSGHTELDDENDFVSGLHLCCFGMAENRPSKEQVVANKASFKQMLLSRYGSGFLTDLQALYGSITQRTEQATEALRTKIDASYAKELQQLKQGQERCQQQARGEISKLTAAIGKKSIPATCVSNDSATLESAGWYLQESTNQEGFSTVLKMNLKKQVHQQRKITFVIDGSGSMGNGKNSRWGMTIEALQEALRKALEKWGAECRFTLFLFGEGVKLIYENAVITEEIINQLVAAEGPLIKARQQGIRSGTYYITAINALVAKAITGAVIFMTDGKPNESTQKISQYVVDEATLKHHNIDIIPIFMTTPEQTNNVWLQLLSRYSASASQGNELPVLAIHQENITNFFAACIDQDLIQQELVRYKVKIFGVKEDGEEVECSDVADYIFCNGEQSRIDINAADKEFYTHYLLRAYQTSDNNIAFQLQFGVNNYSLKPFSDEWERLEKQVREIENEKEQEFRSNKPSLQLFRSTVTTASSYSSSSLQRSQSIFNQMDGGVNASSQPSVSVNFDTWGALSSQYSIGPNR
jgi:hypothetical protein